MRLAQQQIDVIKRSVAEIFGSDTQVKLFGSRVDDNAKGGDIDLLIISPSAIEHPLSLASKLAAKIYRVCHGRKTDIVVDAPNIEKQPIHSIANQTGILL